MKVLITTGDFSKYVAPEFHYLLTELSHLCDLTVWHESGNINDILEQLGFRPDFIFINEFGETNAPKITGLASLTIPFAVCLYDLHYRIEERKEAMQRENVKYVFTHFRDRFYEWYPEYSRHMLWFPLHVNTNVFKDYGLTKDIDFLLMGSVHERVYPLRYKILQTMKDDPRFVYHEHPGYRNFDNEEMEGVFIKEKYVREINRAKIFFTDGLWFRYAITKYFEVLACKTLLLASTSKELNDLGFIPGVHYVEINEDNFKDKAEYYLSHEKEREEIAEQGYEMVRSRHTTVHRASQLLGMIEGILAAQ